MRIHTILFISASFALTVPVTAQAQSAPMQATVLDVDYSIAPLPEKPVGSDDRPVAPSCCSKPGPQLNMSADVESKALFTDQAFTATDRPTAVTDVNITVDGWMLDIWHRQPLTSHRCDRETDYGIFKTFTVAKETEVEAKAAYIAVCGRDAVTTRLRVTRGLGNGFAAQAGVERIRGGFVDNVVRAQLSYHRDLDTGKRWSLDASTTVAHSDYGKGFTLAGSATLSRRFASGWTFETYGTAFTGHLGTDFAVGFGLRRSFSLGR